MTYSLVSGGHTATPTKKLTLNSFIYLALVLILTGCQGGYVKSVQVDKGGKAVSYGQSVELPENVHPNDATISEYNDRNISWTSRNKFNGNMYVIKPKGNAVAFTETPNPISISLEQELSEGFLLSYLYYDDGVVKYNGKAKKGRFRKDITDDTLLLTNSTGKTIASYILGHAVCKGYISSIDEPVDWPMFSETLYQGQPLINLLNMAAGDTHLYNKETNRLLALKDYHSRDIGLDTIAEYLKGTQPKNHTVKYNNMLTDMIASYVVFKAGDDYDELIREIFQDKIKIENEVLVELHRPSLTKGIRSPYYGELQTRMSYSFQFTRLDLLRVAVAMMKDYQQNTCVGKYLKEVQSRAQKWPKYDPLRDKNHFWLLNYARKYGGQTYWDFYGMSNRNILGTDGLHGQHILIDMDNSKIVVTNSASVGFDVRHFILNAIRDGAIPK